MEELKQFEFLISDEEFREFAVSVMDFGKTTKYEPPHFVILLEMFVKDMKEHMGIKTLEEKRVVGH